MGGTNFHLETSVRRLRASATENVRTYSTTSLTAKGCVANKVAIVVAKPTKAKGSCFTYTLNSETYEGKQGMLCFAVGVLVRGLGLTRLRKQRAGFFQGLGTRSLLVVSSFKVIGLSNRVRRSFRRVVSSQCGQGTLVLTDRLPITS